MKRLVLAFPFALLISCSATTLNLPCTTNADCESGQACNTAAPGGACIKNCSVEGKTTECPYGSICTVGNPSLTCGTFCTDDNGCRAGFACTAVAGSTKKGCVVR